MVLGAETTFDVGATVFVSGRLQPTQLSEMVTQRHGCTSHVRRQGRGPFSNLWIILCITLGSLQLDDWGFAIVYSDTWVCVLRLAEWLEKMCSARCLNFHLAGGGRVQVQ